MPQGHAVLISDHDYRTPRRANMHPIADALVRLGYAVTFVSVRFSRLSRIKGDSRTFLWDRANRPEMHNGVRCYLWRTPVHPFYPRRRGLDEIATQLYRAYARWPNRFFDDALSRASHIVVESGLGASLLRRARTRNRAARIAYVASDELKTVGTHPFLQAQLERAAGCVDQFCLPSPRMAPGFAFADGQTFHVPHGLDTADFSRDAANPYTQPANAVSVGSMLFDPQVFAVAAARIPELTFHVIGAGVSFEAPPNVRQYPEMPFRDTIGYVRHADIGIAPYRAAPGCDYICDTSMKLMQYEHFGLPAVCPDFAAGFSPHRFGYSPGDPDSIESAFRAALLHGRNPTPRRFLSWEDVARRVLDPRAFSDTHL
jgi:2-beta-glucuronyltransferase